MLTAFMTSLSLHRCGFLTTFIGATLAIALTGCGMYRGPYSSNYQTKVPITPKPLPDRKIHVFAYTTTANCESELLKIKDTLAPSYEVIGISRFQGNFANPHEAKEFIERKGCNLMISVAQRIEDKEVRVSDSHSNATTVDYGYLFMGKPSGIVNSEAHSRSTSWTERIGQYEQVGIFLRDISAGPQLWESTYQGLSELLDQKSYLVYINDEMALASYRHLNGNGEYFFFLENRSITQIAHQRGAVTDTLKHQFPLPGQINSIKRGDLVGIRRGKEWSSYFKAPVNGVAEQIKGDQMKIVFQDREWYFQQSDKSGYEALARPRRVTAP